MIKKITYEDKVSIQNDENIARKNKVTDEDMNEIKEVVNCNAQDFEIAKTDISNIKSEQTMQNTKITDLETDNTTNKEDISNLKESVETLETDKTEKEKIISDLKEENERLKEDLKGLPKGQASGESIDLNDSAEMRMLEFEIGGNSRQETREGYNLLVLVDGTYTNSGITAVVKDGIVTLNGTATDTSFLTILLTTGNITLLSNTQYTLRAYNDKTVGDSENICALRLGADGMKQANLYNANARYTYKQESDYTFSSIIIRTANGITYNNYVIKPQLELGDGTDNWEQGGSSPSPDYPSEVESCGDNVNLSGIDSVSTISNGYLNSNTGSCCYVRANKTYTISFNSKVEGKVNVRGLLYSSGTANNSWTEVLVSNLTLKDEIYATFTPNQNCYVAFSGGAYNDGNDLEDIFYNIKIEEGSIPTIYSKYGQGNINIEICNKNKLKTEFTENNKLTATASREGYYILTNYRAYLEAGKTYSFSCKTDLKYGLKQDSGKVVCYLMLDKKFDYFVQVISNPRKIMVNKTGWYYLRYDIYENNTTASFWDFQLEEGEATDYTPHQSQTYTIPTQKPFRKVGEYKDTFVKKDGKWYERHWIKRLILDGTETFVLVNEVDNTHLFRLSSIKLPIEHYAENYICNYFIANGAKFDTDLIGSYVYDSTIRFRVNSSIATTIDEFKTWLSDQYNAGTPVYVDYVIANLQDIECTSEQTEILNKIKNEAKTYKGVTHIYSADKVEPNIEVTYLKDIEMMIGG